MRTSPALAVLLLLQAAPAALAQLELPAIFGDHMVLQREDRAPVWGRAAPGAEVQVRAGWLADPVRADAGDGGRWRVDLPTGAAGGPYEVEVTSGEEHVVFRDVLLGEVWICGGQSNMEWTLGPGVGNGVEGWRDEVAAADRPDLRYFDVAHAFGLAPFADCQGEWRVSSPATAGTFSAVGYFFGCELADELDCPIGLVGVNWGGTRAEAWTSAAGLAPLGDFDEMLERIGEARADAEATAAIADAQPPEPPRRTKAAATWWAHLAERDPGSSAGWQAPDLDDSDWDELGLPVLWEDAGFADVDGVVWFRRAVEIPAAWAGRELELTLGGIDDMDTTWFGGARVGGFETDGHWQTPRSYRIPAELASAGRQVVAVRVVDTGGAGGFNGEAEALAIGPADSDERASLAGPWRARRGAPMDKLGAWPVETWFGHNSPTALSNGMLAPVVPYAMRGAIFYQGESNRAQALQYRHLFPAMIGDWRARWRRGDFPFYFVQIAPYNYGGDTGEAGMLRDAQRRALALPATGMAVTMDVGNPADIHPLVKRPVGERLARWALAGAYGREGLVVSGPLYRSMAVDGAALRVEFDHTGGGLVAREGALTHFELCGADGVWHAAVATIADAAEAPQSVIVVESDAVPEPVAVRYGWPAACEPNLFNAAGLPASTFTSED